MELTEEIARTFARAALGHVAREYPHKLDHVMASDADVLPPRVLHPVFFGSFDWHSCVHGWWTLLRLRRRFPAMPEAKAIEALADATFTREKIGAELDYLARPEARGFERPYGWGWLLALHDEACRHPDQHWGEAIEPLARAFAERLGSYLEILTYPITVGTHFNTAFALVLAREWAEERDPALLKSIDKWSVQNLENKTNYQGWEPGGDEFLSPVLIVGLLMSAVMPPAQFGPWFSALAINNGWVEQACHPVTVSDRSDGKIAHLDGLNLSRAWCLGAIAARLGDDPARPLLERRASDHLGASFEHVTGDYMGEHWLASFALLALAGTS
ncbi:DUF2891 domain-containing protein [Qipengyuania nanhaisediminis]|uniref:DUF2891 domain-containing protein n=1 Tax=Qipengyuania nanhaisediminis TaxID=604088 RepID=UPI0038B37B36